MRSIRFGVLSNARKHVTERVVKNGRNDLFSVSLGSYYGHKAFELGVGDENGYGAVFKITYESGKHIYVTMGDSKADEDTDEKNMYALGGIYGDKYNNLLEFIYSTKSELSDYRHGNAVSVTGQEKIIDIAVVNDVSIKW